MSCMFIKRVNQLLNLHSKFVFFITQTRGKTSSVIDNKTVTGSSVKSNMTRPQNYDYFLVLDFEATCQKDVRINPQEIIEFPVLKVSGVTFDVESTFHKYVQPEVNKQLTPFCTELTGIIQDMVDGQPHITETLQMFQFWLETQGLLKDEVKSVFVTCGDWDLQTMLPHQATYFTLQYPDLLKTWINIKKPFCDVTGTYPKGMMEMLEELGLRHVGRHHSGIDDCRNIASILKALAERGYVFKATGQLKVQQ